ncbi:MAG: DNA mismatch repair protein MutS [Chloroflexi bacterium]|nr:DNA mismatch repair protein MutS [Chloroflexota bacterium]
MSTPVRRQYLAIKKRFPNTIVFFRLGDFYETFDEDAKTVAQVCDIVLTSRPVGKDQRVPLAGVPYHAVDGYLAKLIGAGYKVAIVEQVSDPKESKGLVAREVVRVVTPGTVVEPTLLDERRNNFLAALTLEDRRAGLAYVDITTGEFATTQFSGDDAMQEALQELARLQPAECLIPARPDAPERAALRGVECPITEWDAWRFDVQTAREALLQHFGVGTLAGFGCEGLPQAIRAAGAIVQYLQETQKAALAHLDSLTTYSTSHFMTLDASTRRNLELVATLRTGAVKGSLLGVLDLTRTSMGGRMLRQWLLQPLVEKAAIERRLDAVEALYNATPQRMKIRELLGGVGDLERLTNRLAQGIATPRDLLGLARALRRVPDVAAALDAILAGLPGGHPLAALRDRLNPCQAEADLIEVAIAEDAPATLANGGVIRPGYSDELDAIARASRDAKQWVAGLEQRERQRTGIKSLKVGYNKVFGYYIEVSKANMDRVPPDYVRKQTLVNGERFITPELKEYESLILNAQERRLELETRLYKELCERLATARGRMLDTGRALAELDVLASLAEVAVRNRYTRPEVAEDGIIDIREGRHPVVELTQKDEPFVPNDVRLVPGEGEIIILTGPNMAGKSTFLRQVALIVLMAQVGSFVPAQRAHIGIVDRIFTRIGAQDEIAAGQSTFMVEMVEVANILHHATSASLLILDEVGRGTSTYDGISIAWAVVEHIHNHPRLRAKTLFATHYHELTDLAGTLPRVRNFSMAVAEEGDRVIFLRKVIPGGADRSYGIHVAQLAGLPKSVIHRAEELLRELESGQNGAAIKPSAPRAKQLSFLTESDPVLQELRDLDISAMTPLEAINKLYEFQRRVGKG